MPNALDQAPTAVSLLHGTAVGGLLDRYPAEFGGLEGLARALGSSPIWGQSPDAALVVRPSPPLLAVAGYLCEESRDKLKALRDALSSELASLRYVDYRRAEGDALLLAERLVDRLGTDHVNRCHFVPLPRGGLIVLGLLSYALHLRHDQFGPPPPDAPLVLVDDCILTGARVQDALGPFEGRDVTVAVLYAHPDVRSSIEARGRVQACVSAHDLDDRAPRILGPAYDAWRTRWSARSERFWYGMPEHLGFAWNEPEVSLWNPRTQDVDLGWRLLPPDGCRTPPPESSPPLPVQVLGGGMGPLQFAESAVLADLGDRVVVCEVDAGGGYVLTGTAAAACRALLIHTDPKEAAQHVSADLHLSAPAARFMTDRVLRQLETLELLRRA